MNHEKFDKILNDLHFIRQPRIEIVSETGYTPGYISEIKKKLGLLKHEPKEINNTLVCQMCDTPDKLVFYKSIFTGEMISLTCVRCAEKLKIKERTGKISFNEAEKQDNIDKLIKEIERVKVMSRQQASIIDTKHKEVIFWKVLCEKFVKDQDLDDKETEVVMKWLN